MADIDIQKKKRNPVWLWIIGILVLLGLILLIYWLLNKPAGDPTGMTGDRDTTEQADRHDTVDREQSPPVNDYLTWANELQRKEPGVHHEFTKTGLQRMADALASIAMQSESVNRSQFDNKLSTMRNMADSITIDPESTQHANKIKNAFETSVDVMEELQETSFPELKGDINNYKQEVNRFDAKELTLEQSKKIKTIFRQAGDVLRKMDNRVEAKRQSNGKE